MPLCSSRPTIVGADDVDRLALAQLRARDDEESRRREAVLLAERGGFRGAEDDALLWCLLHPSGRGSHDEQDEPVEQDEERDLQDQERLVGFESKGVTTARSDRRRPPSSPA